MASIAPTSEGRSIVACWATWALPAKVTRPTSMLLGQLAQEASSPLPARPTMRVGLTSFTRMLSDTSIASMIVDLAQGSVTGAVGRATASSSTRQCQQEQCRRNVPPPLAARRLANDAQAAEPQRRLAPSTQQPQVQRRQQGQRQHQPQVLRPQEVHLRRRAHHESADPWRAQSTHGLGRTSIEHGFWRKRSAMSHANERFLSPRAFRLGRHHGVDPRTRPNRFSVRLNACGLRTTAAR